MKEFHAVANLFPLLLGAAAAFSTAGTGIGRASGRASSRASSSGKGRRHLSGSQRAMVAARLAKMMETEAIKRKGRPTDLAADLQPCRRRRFSGEAFDMVKHAATEARELRAAKTIVAAPQPASGPRGFEQAL